MVMHAMPSLCLLLSFETFLSQIRVTVQRQNIQRSLVDLAEQRAAAQQVL